MDQNFGREQRLRQYLLDELDDHERTRLEEEYFRDDQAFEELVVVEDDLIDAYVAGRLTTAERQQFDQRFLTTPARRERVAFARTLRKGLGHVTPASAVGRTGSEPGWWDALVGWWRAATVPQWSMAAAALALVVGASWLALDRGRLRSELATLQTQASELAGRTQQLQGELEGERRRADALAAGRGAPAPLVASFLLTSGVVRGAGGSNALRLPQGAALVRLQLELEMDTHPRYRPVLETVGGEQVWTQQSIAAERRAEVSVVTIELPASLLASRDYVLTLHGERPGGKSEEVAAYSFRFSKE